MRIEKKLVMAAGLFALTGFVFAQNAPPSADWQKVHRHQPKALHLKMSLSKDHFYQGEKIEATLEFSNDDHQKPFSLEVGAGSPGATFHGWDVQGHDLVDPLQWRNDWEGIFAEGPVGVFAIDEYTLKRPVNENVRFDQSSVYSIYAQASVVAG